jgi:2-polyprenyl-6-hydroxyphenyl methylase / 3-demethylubiquinone-9 3-methyltransferase
MTAVDERHNAPKGASTSSVDPDEVAKFGNSAKAWWDGTGPYRPLHVLNPTRIAIIKQALETHFRLDVAVRRPLEPLGLLDLGCGGGLVAEPMARLGARVTGVDPSAANIAVAASHAERLGLAIEYRHGTAEGIAEIGQTFDVVLALEIIEHTSDPFGFIATCAHLVAPGGLLVVSTLNRSLRSLALAKVAAEHVLRWVPKGTHAFRKFVTPRELRQAFEAAGLVPQPAVGMTYRPLKDEWRRSLDTRVNYIMWASRPR